MSLDVYRRLAERLDAIPNGFPSTESGAELRLLAKIFTPGEAALASVMRLSREPAEIIADRAGTEPQETARTLKAMARKGQIRAGRKGGKLVFGLMPFVVGFYEEQLPRIDEELARLFEEYFQEVHGSFVHYAPSIHRVLPVEEAIPAGIDIYPHERASELLESAQAWGVRDCICRVQRSLLGKACEHPIENCLVFAPVAGVFDHSDTTRAISKEEALRILAEAEEAGLVHSPGNFRDGHNYICNCCTCSCGVLRNVAEFSLPTAIARSAFVATVDADACAGCGDCLDRCQFGAISLPDAIAVVDAGCCVGCGLCASPCPAQAIHLERRPEGDFTPPPSDYMDWMAQRARARGLDSVA